MLHAFIHTSASSQCFPSWWALGASDFLSIQSGPSFPTEATISHASSSFMKSSVGNLSISKDNLNTSHAFLSTFLVYA